MVDRGRPSTYINAALVNYDKDLSRMNKSKVGAPYEYTDMLIIAGFAIKTVFKEGYRGAAGTVADYTDRIGMGHPDFRTLQWRVADMEKEGIEFRIYERDKNDIEVLIDASGVKSVNDGEYRSTKYGKVKNWDKIHIAVDRKTRRILNIIVTGNDVGDVREFVPLMEPIEAFNYVKSATADGAYGSEENFKHCDANGVEPIIPVRVTDRHGRHKKERIEEQLGWICSRGSPWRNRHLTREQMKKNQERWKDRIGYHGRSLVETTFSVFKGAFGEYTFSKTDDMREKELLLKAVVYNTFLI